MKTLLLCQDCHEKIVGCEDLITRGVIQKYCIHCLEQNDCPHKDSTSQRRFIMRCPECERRANRYED
jgi:hypothetical protein